jgi:hypothetical protein
MRMQCNIDARGKAARLVIGGVLALAGSVLIALHVFEALPEVWALYVGSGVVIVGGIAIFEGWTGWCAMRAMGFKTRV